MSYEILQGDVRERLKDLPEQSVQTVITSPPYWGLRDYGVEGQLGLETSPDAYVQGMVEVFREVRRVLKDDGTVWLNLGDSYASTTGVKTSHPQQSRNGHGVCGSRDLHPSASRANLTTFKDFGEAKPKDLLGIPWRVAFALQADGWYLRSDIIWHKPNPMPESVTDRPTKSHEYLFLLTKQERYLYNYEAVKEPAVGKNAHDLTGPGYTAPGQAPNSGNRKALRSGIESRHRSSIPGGQSLQAVPDGKRNRRSVWSIPTQPFKGAHFATMPEKLVEPCILAGSREGDTVLDPFAGSGTVGVVARHHGRKFVGIELNPEYVTLAHERIAAGSRKLAA